MLELLFNFILGVINNVSSIFMAPISSAVSLLLPGFSDLVGDFFTFLSMGLQYVGFICKLFMIPSNYFMFIIAQCLAIVTFNTVIRTIMLSQSVYHYFKP